VLDQPSSERDDRGGHIVAKKQSAKQKSDRTLNRTTGKAPAVKKSTTRNQSEGAPFNEQDPKRRLGNFGSAGEHPRQGGRTSGIVGQTKQKNKTDK
jgi:hypothetical protein